MCEGLSENDAFETEAWFTCNTCPILRWWVSFVSCFRGTNTRSQRKNLENGQFAAHISDFLHCKVAWKVCYFWLAGGRPTWTWKYETEHFSYCTRVYQLICLQYLHRINSSFHFHLLSKRMPWNRFIQHTYTFAAFTHHLAIHIKFRCSALQICEVMAICKADHNSNELFPVFAKRNKKVSLLSAVKTEIFIAGMIK